MKTRCMLALLMAQLGLAATAGSAEVEERDPTLWPPALRAAVSAARPASGASGASAAEAALVPVQQVVFSGGQAYLVLHGRRYGVGEQLDGARIERITEQAVWLRESGRLRREPLYGGVEKRPATAAATATVAASGASAVSTAVKPAPKKSKEKP